MQTGKNIQKMQKKTKIKNFGVITFYQITSGCGLDGRKVKSR